MMIEIDDEVFAFLQARARPLIDTPNDVLRLVLLGDSGDNETKISTPNVSNSRPDEGRLVVKDKDKSVQALVREEGYRKEFCDFLLQNEFGGNFEKCGRYQWMFENSERIVYFQNFNKESDKTWYRLHGNAIRRLKSADKEITVCFTNPLEAYAYVIPYSDIEKKAESIGYDKDSMEVNIDNIHSRWHELKWNISPYLRKYEDWKSERDDKPIQ